MNEQHVLITGVGRRIGLHLANTFLQRGFQVTGTYRTERDSLHDLTANGARLVRCDFSNEGSVSALVNRMKDDNNHLRAIIHNASDWASEASDTPPIEVMKAMMAVHVHAPYQINLGLEAMLQGSSDAPADIIHIGDYVSTRGSKKHIAYAASKAAQDNLTLSFAARLAPRVKVNSIAPALVLFNDGDDEAYRNKALSKSLMQREAGLDEMLHNVDYLMNSQYVTGRIIHMDGGRHLV